MSRGCEGGVQESPFLGGLLSWVRVPVPLLGQGPGLPSGPCSWVGQQSLMWVFGLWKVLGSTCIRESGHHRSQGGWERHL